MKIEKKIENWCQDTCFVNFTNQRMHQELTERPENKRYDILFEELDEAFEYDDRYIGPLVEYLTCRLHIAINRTYIRLIIFWRGDTGLFFITDISSVCE